MKRMFIRLDDACPKRDVEKWDRMEALLDKHSIKPLVGIIPDCRDPDMDKYPEDINFWKKSVPCWEKKGWILALHGYQHVFHTNDGGINPVNKRSEFAGLSLEVQKKLIREGLEILRNHGITPEVFFAPAHTFDENTLIALKEESNIRYISDTPANDVYCKNGFTNIPQQAGHVRALPFKTITFCYHPNAMQEKDFDNLELFLQKHKISDFQLISTNRMISVLDLLLMRIYYWRHNA